MRVSSGTRRQFVEVVPVDHDAGRARDRDQVQRVVGRAAGGQQRDDGVDDAFLVDDMADRHVLPPCWEIATARWDAAAVSASRSGVPGVMKAAPGRCRPIISISIWLLLAVP
jgi:diadenosine tetraphosphatase ApaH/serine/threonine PP2A family protein phosphatase